MNTRKYALGIVNQIDILIKKGTEYNDITIVKDCK